MHLGEKMPRDFRRFGDLSDTRQLAIMIAVFVVALLVASLFIEAPATGRCDYAHAPVGDLRPLPECR